MRLRNFLAPVGIICAFFVSAYGNCPVNSDTTLVIRAETGDLQIETNGRNPVVEVQAGGASVHENCSAKRAEYNGSVPGIWKVMAPRDIDLDLVAVGGNIRVGDVDGNVFLRTTGGSVTVGSIPG